MKYFRILFSLALSFMTLSAQAAEALTRQTWMVDGVERQALVHASTGSGAAPVVFVFHGHGGSSQNAARSFGIETLWPEAIVVYPQGLPTPGQLTDPEGKRSGWQGRPGLQDDRDLKFFDVMLAALRKDHRVDDRRIYSTGHSNGGGFTYLLWAKRGDVFAAVAPSAAAAPTVMKLLKPKPVMHLAGEADPLVKYTWQQATMTKLREINGCSATGTEWAPMATKYPSPSGNPVVTFIHPGGHQFVREAPPLIVRFFKEHARP